MSVTPESIIEFLNSRATNTPLRSAELEVFTSELKAQINQLSVDVPTTSPDSVTVLYSGFLPNEQNSAEIVNALVAADPGKIRTVGQSEVGKLLSSSQFREALLLALGDDLSDFNELVSGEDNLRNRTSSNSLWDDASRRFVSNTTGVVRVVSTDGKLDSVFAKSELPAIFETNNGITEIDGIPKDQYLT